MSDTKLVLRRGGVIVAKIELISSQSFTGFTATLFGKHAGQVHSGTDLKAVKAWAERETAPQIIWL